MTAKAATRPVVLTFVGHYLPGFKAGGPIRTLANMVEQLGGEFDFRIVAADRDLGDLQPFPDIAVDRWVERGRGKVFYRSPGPAGWRAVFATPEARSPHIVYLNSLFSYAASIRPLVEVRAKRLARAPVILAPRGELSPGALGLKPLKKKGFIRLSQMTGLHADVLFQASSAFEADDIRRAGLLSTVMVAPDLPPASSARGGGMDKRSERGADHSRMSAANSDGRVFRLVCLARIAPMKNLLGAIDILSRVGDTRVDFDIYGVMEDPAYWARCQAAIAALPGTVRVQYKGPLRPDEVETVLSGYDAFLFPTLGENYGHVIREALSAGLPVLISDRTPWRDLAEKGAGADLPLEAPQAFADQIVAWAGMATADLQAMREAARSVGDDPVSARAALNANREMFLAALHKPR